jgi:hypothetical protein
LRSITYNPLFQVTVRRDGLKMVLMLTLTGMMRLKADVPPRPGPWASPAWRRPASSAGQTNPIVAFLPLLPLRLTNPFPE